MFLLSLHSAAPSRKHKTHEAVFRQVALDRECLFRTSFVSQTHSPEKSAEKAEPSETPWHTYDAHRQVPDQCELIVCLLLFNINTKC